MIHLSKAHPISAQSEAPCRHGDSETSGPGSASARQRLHVV